MGETLSYFFQEISTPLAVLSTFLALVVAVLTVSKTIKYAESRRRLERKLHDLEVRCQANLSDANDRELRRMVSYLRHHSEHDRALTRWTNELKSHSLQEICANEKNKDTIDSFIFARAFDALNDKEKSLIVENIRLDNSESRVRYLRNLLAHAHQAQTRDEMLPILVRPSGDFAQNSGREHRSE